MEETIVSINMAKTPGVHILSGRDIEDKRGWFWKAFEKDKLDRAGLSFSCQEIFYSYSIEGVVRGMHYQGKPSASSKIVTCLTGHVLDVILDLRRSSSRYGRAEAFWLDEYRKRSIFIPPGVAHGFYVKRGPAIMSYQTDMKYYADADFGIKWNSIPFDWPISELEGVIESDRDKNLPLWESFITPFE
jgi:dTDP-4-dehydrorhamnose 3,5-epimerase